MEMVGGERVQNAVSLNSVLTNASRAVGPAIAGGLIGSVGVAVCFLANGLLVAVLATTGLQPLITAAGLFGSAMFAAAAVPALPGELAAMALIGAAGTAFMATGNSTMQLTTDPSFRGRVMALWAVTFSGSTPIGAPIIGAVSEFASPRAGLLPAWFPGEEANREQEPGDCPAGNDSDIDPVERRS